MRSANHSFRAFTLLAVLAGGVLALPLWALAGQSDEAALETVFYSVDSKASRQAFAEHGDQISAVGPQVFSLDEEGTVWGEVSPQVVEQARRSGTRVIPLIVNPGFDQGLIHDFLTDKAARRRAVSMMVGYAQRYGFDGWQFDFENIRVTDRARYTAFCREAARAFDEAGLELSIAVVPRRSELPGPTGYHRWLHSNWQGAFALEALAEAADFLTLMTYDQHTSATPPGPIAGLPWVEASLRFVLDQGIAPEKISLGIPLYSGHWRPHYVRGIGAAPRRTKLAYQEARRLVEQRDTKLEWNKTQQVYHADWARAGVFEYLFLEEARSFRAKLELVREYGLRGFSAWRLGQADPAIWEDLEQNVDVR